jgi:hypothetical protein
VHEPGLAILEHGAHQDGVAQRDRPLLPHPGPGLPHAALPAQRTLGEEVEHHGEEGRDRDVEQGDDQRRMFPKTTRPIATSGSSARGLD